MHIAYLISVFGWDIYVEYSPENPRLPFAIQSSETARHVLCGRLRVIWSPPRKRGVTGVVNNGREADSEPSNPVAQ